MTRTWNPERFELAEAIRPGDAIVWGQACGEPQTLIEALVSQRATLGGLKVFIGAHFSQILRPEHTDSLEISGLGGVWPKRACWRYGRCISRRSARA